MNEASKLSSNRFRPKRLLRAMAVTVAYGFFAVLPLEIASALGGWIGRLFGPYLKGSAIARHNLALALPELSEKNRETIIRDMWDNLGRVMAEFPHLYKFQKGGRAEHRVTYTGAEYAQAAARDNRPGIFVAGHLGNWELNALSIQNQGIDLAVVFRPPNNPWVARLLHYARRMVAHQQIPKGNSGLRELIRILKEGGHIGLLVDQKMNTGIPVPFFGHNAKTAPAAATLAYRFDCPVILTRVERLKGARFHVTFLPPLGLPRTGNAEADTLAVMTHVNKVLESWIRERPAQWLWMHRRWPESGRRDKSQG